MIKPLFTLLATCALAAASIATATAVDGGRGKPGTAAYNTWLATTFVQSYGRVPAEKMNAASAQIVADDYVQHNPLAASAGPGRAGLLRFFSVVNRSFPDGRFDLHSVVATPDRVAARWTFSATFNGAPFLGIAPTGKRIAFDGIDWWTVRDGKLYEHWDQIDWTRFLDEVGTTKIPDALRAGASP